MRNQEKNFYYYYEKAHRERLMILSGLQMPDLEPWEVRREIDRLELIDNYLNWMRKSAIQEGLIH